MTAPPWPTPDAVCDGGDLDCGSGLLLIIRNAMAPLRAGGILEVRSREMSVREDLPAWWRMVGHTLLDTQAADGGYIHYALRKKSGDEALQADLEQARTYTWQTRVRWTDGMRGKAFARNHSFPVGQVASFDTEDAAPSAVEYLLGALGGALVVGFQWRLSQAASPCTTSRSRSKRAPPTFWCSSASRTTAARASRALGSLDTTH